MAGGGAGAVVRLMMVMLVVARTSTSLFLYYGRGPKCIPSCEEPRATNKDNWLPYGSHKRMCEANEWDDDKVKELFLDKLEWETHHWGAGRKGWDKKTVDEIFARRSCTDFLPPT